MDFQRPMFVAYEGEWLTVGESLLAEICDFFPELDVREELRQMEWWLSEHPRRRGTRRFVKNWMAKAERQRQREMRKQMEIQRELMVGGGPR